jgi:hypothetical protein
VAGDSYSTAIGVRVASARLVWFKSAQKGPVTGRGRACDLPRVGVPPEGMEWCRLIPLTGPV